MHGEELPHGLTVMVPGAVLNQDDGLAGLRQHFREKRLVAVAIEAFRLTFPE
jgi:hypothetical protein